MRFEIWERSMRTGWSRCLLFRAEPSGVMIVPDGEERVFLAWDKVRQIYISRLLPRRGQLVVETEPRTYAVTICEFVPSRRMPKVQCRFSLISDDKTPRYFEMESVLAHFRDDRILKQIQSVRPSL